jgi:hypothetical protein
MKNYKIIKNTVLTVCALMVSMGNNLHATADAPNPLFNVPYKHVQFMRPGGENGRAVLTLDGQPHQVCALMNKQGTARNLPGESQLMFGHAVKDAQGKYQCYALGWEGWKPYSFDQYSDATFLVHAPKGGTWKKATDVQDFSGAVIAVKKDPENPWNTGISTQDGIPGKFHTDLKGHWGAKGGSQTANVMVFFPNENVASAATSAADTPNPWFGEAYSPDMKLVKLGAENGLDILKDPEGKQVCLAKFQLSDGRVFVRFGVVDGTNCNMTVGGARSVTLNGDDARLVHIPKGGAWLPLNDAKAKGYIAPDKMLMRKEQSNPGYSKSAGTGSYYLSYQGLWYAKNNQELNILEANGSDKIEVFVPGVAATSAAANTADAPNPLFNVPYKHVQFMRPGGENGRAVLTLDGQPHQVCALMNKQGTARNLPGESQLMFGHAVKDAQGKYQCYALGWEGWKPYSFDQYSDATFLVHAPKGGTWKKATDVQDFSGAVIAVKKDPENPWNTGISTQDGIPGKFHTDLKGHWGAKGGSQTANVMVFFPNENVASAATSAADTPNPWFGEAYSPDMKLVKLGAENGFDILKDPEGKQVCLAKFQLSDGRVFVRFGVVDGTNCNMTVGGARSVTLNGDDARLVHIPKGGAWLPLNDAKAKGYIAPDKMLMRKEQSNPGYSKSAGTGSYYLSYKGLWYAKNNQELNILEANGSDKIEVFVPGVAATSAAANTADAPNPLFNVPYKHVQFMRPGGENGRAVLTLDGQPHQVCALMNKQGTARNLPGESQLMFGHAVKDAQGKYQCYALGWEGWKPYSFDQYSDATFLVHAPKGGTWKKATDVQDFFGAVIAVKKDPENPWNTGISTQDGIPGKFHTDLKGHWGAKGGSQTANVMVFFPNENVASAATSAADTPNPWFGEAYSPDMKLVKLGAENGFDILKDPEGKQVCLAKFQLSDGRVFVRFGVVDGTNCNMTVGGARSVTLNGDDARLVHIPKGGAWLPLNDAKAKGYIAPDKMLMRKEQSNPGYSKSAGTGSYYLSYKGLWYAKNNQELNILEANGADKIEVFVPGVAATSAAANTADAPNPWFDKAYSQDLSFVSLGGENGREILKTPEGKQVCVAYYEPQKVLRFGHVDGTDCRLGAWGPTPVSLNTDKAKLVQAKKPGNWMTVSDAEQKQLISKEKALMDADMYPSFIPGDNAGGSYFLSANRTWFAKNNNGQWSEQNNADKNKIQIFVIGAAAPVATNTADTPNPWFGEAYSPDMKLVKLGAENGFDILKDPEGKQVCLAKFQLSDGRVFVRFGVVDGTNCNMTVGGARSVTLNGDDARLVHIPKGGAWLPLNDAKAKGYIAPDKMLMRKEQSNPGYSKSAGTGSYYLSYKGLWYAKNNQELNILEANGADKIEVFVPGVAATSAAANTADAPNPWFDKAYSQDLSFVSLGGENGREILKTPEGKQVCVAYYEPQKVLRFGHVDGTDCRLGAWGPTPVSLNTDKAKLVQAKKPGNWMTVSDAEQKQLISKEKALMDADMYPSFIPGDNAGGSYFLSANRTWFAKNNNGQWSEQNNADKNKIQIFVIGAAAPVATNTADTPNPWFGEAYSPDMKLVKLGAENGLDILKDPEGKQVCLAKFQLSDGRVFVRFGVVDGTNCNMTVGGARSVTLNGDDARLVHIPKGGAWLPLNDAKAKGYIAPDKMLMRKEQSNPGYSKSAGTGSYYLSYQGLWYAKNNQELNILEANGSDKIEVFVPGVAAISAAANTADAPNPWFGVAFQNVEFVRPGGENGRAIFTAPDTQNQVCAVAYNLGSLKGPGEAQVPFGYALDINGKKTCRIEAWGQHDYAFDEYPQNVFLVHAKTQGSWKPIKEMKDNDWKEMVLVPAAGAQKTHNGIASFNGIPGKTHMNHRNYYGGSGDVNNKQAVVTDNENVRIYMPTQPAVVSSAAAANTAGSTGTTAATVNTAGSTETAASTGTTAATTDTATAAVSQTAEVSIVTQTAQGPITAAQVLTAINESRVVVDDPDVAVELEAQKPISLDGEAFKWVDFGKGFALQPVSLSPTSGVICRLFGPNNQAYIGNVYKNNRTTTSDIALSEIKVGEFVCRAGTDLQGNRVHITSQFQTLGNRGGDVLWAPITSTQAPMWETGYKAINVGGEVTENGKTFKASGICRISKAAEPTKFHIGRAVVDQNNIMHCYLKAKGVETDITGQPLQSVEVLIKPNLAQAAVSATVGQQGIMGLATGSTTVVNPFLGNSVLPSVNSGLQSAAPVIQTPVQTIFG